MRAACVPPRPSQGEMHMSAETIIILMLVAFIVGLITGVKLGRPTIRERER